MWTDTLLALLGSLALSPTYAGGGSLSISICLLLAFRHPELVKGMLLIAPPTDDPQSWRWLADSGYGKSAEMAATQGMQAVIETSFNWSADWPRLIQQNSVNRERLLRIEPSEFASVMRQWAQSLVSGRAHCGGLTPEQLHTITSPAIIVPGLNGLHPQHDAEELHRHLPNSELAVLAEHFSSEELKQLRQWAEAGEGWRFDAAFGTYLRRFHPEA